MKIVFTDNRFIFRVPFESRNIARDGGFHWSVQERCWYTRNPGVAAQFTEYCDESAKKQISKFTIKVSEWTGGLTVPKGETLFKFQETAARFALSRNRSYLGLDPGLGKTPIAAVVSHTLMASTIYICPPFLTRNTEVEFKRWAPGLKVSRFAQNMQFNGPEVVIIPDTMLTKEYVVSFVKAFVQYHHGKGRQVQLVIDEAHRFKNDVAQRTRAVFGSRTEKGLASLFERVIYMSGTPMPNRPIELFPVLSHSAPGTIDYMNKFEYGRKYCAGHQNQFGWDFTGASNITLLHSKVIGPFMLRYKKSEVLTELPPKTEEVVLIGDDLPPKLAELDRDLLKHISPEDLMQKHISLKIRGRTEGEDDETPEIHLATYRRELGLLKVKPCVEYYKYLLEETDESILIFAIHKEVIEELKKGLTAYDPLVITGSTDMASRHEIVKTFQTSGPSRRVFIGNIQAAGVGLTLTKATRVSFAEFSWVPAENDQASDRAHRIGQKDNVLVQYMVFKNSIDRAVIDAVLRKKKTLQKFDDGADVL